jgi:glycosyltransferase involved in cell wall biosynthesis
MTEKLRTCAIIPTYNRANYIEQCLHSLFNQTEPVSEIIVVDDGSTDDTEEVLQPYMDRIQYYRKENGGKSSALNVALTKTTADLIWICDDDDIADKEGHKILKEALDANPNADLVCGKYELLIEENGQVRTAAPATRKLPNEDNLHLCFLQVMFSLQFAMLVKRSLYENVGPFNEKLLRAQDYEMTLRLTRAGQGIYIPKTIFYQRQHGGVRGSASERFSEKRNKSKWKEYERSFFRKLSETYAIEEFTPSYAENWEAPLKTRSAYLFKGLALCRRGLWEEGIQNLTIALEQSQKPFTKEELDLSKVFLRDTELWMELSYSPHHVNELRNFSTSQKGRALVFEMCRPLCSQIKQAISKQEYDKAFLLFRVMLRVLGFKATLKRFVNSATSKA